jgi:heterodisulfide reductase subunit C
MSIAAGIEEQARINRFYRAFMDTVRHHGRLHEVELMTSYAGRTNPADLVAYAPLGATLLRKGKISLAPKEMAHPGQIEAMFRKAEEIEPGRRV